MLCGALIDAGASLERAQSTTAALGLGTTVSCSSVHRGAFVATKFDVHCSEPQSDHRHYSDIQAILADAPLSAQTKSRALAVFERIAQVESKAHGIPLEAVHFHEIGAVDSIVDVVVFCDLLEDLSVERILSGPIPVGSGSIKVAHGELNLPTPALVGLAQNWSLRATQRKGEQSTPTGVALLTTLGEEASLPNMTLTGSGHGAGTRNPSSHANITRVLLGKELVSQASREQICVLECQIDDMIPELVPEVIQTLLDNQALDAFSSAILMKKGRPGFAITVICRPQDQNRLCAILFEHSTTLGVRVHYQERDILDRHIRTVETPWGPCRIKIGELHGKQFNAAPEFEDCKALAAKSGVAIKQIYNWALAASLDSGD